MGKVENSIERQNKNAHTYQASMYEECWYRERKKLRGKEVGKKSPSAENELPRLMLK